MKQWLWHENSSYSEMCSMMSILYITRGVRSRALEGEDAHLGLFGFTRGVLWPVSRNDTIDKTPSFRGVSLLARTQSEERYQRTFRLQSHAHRHDSLIMVMKMAKKDNYRSFALCVWDNWTLADISPPTLHTALQSKNWHRREICTNAEGDQ